MARITNSMPGSTIFAAPSYACGHCNVLLNAPSKGVCIYQLPLLCTYAEKSAKHHGVTPESRRHVMI